MGRPRGRGPQKRLPQLFLRQPGGKCLLVRIRLARDLDGQVLLQGGQDAFVLQGDGDLDAPVLGLALQGGVVGHGPGGAVTCGAEIACVGGQDAPLVVIR